MKEKKRRDFQNNSGVIRQQIEGTEGDPSHSNTVFGATKTWMASALEVGNENSSSME